MAIYASKSTRGFYDDSIHTPDQIPRDAVEITKEEHVALLEAQSSGQMISWEYEDGGLPFACDRPVVFLSVEAYSDRLNDSIATIYNKYLRFETEYATREAAARAYKDAGYKGEISVWISSFANAADMSAKDAADLIIGQADVLRTALEQLGCLRMRKYELKGLEGQALLDKYNELNSAVEAIGSSLS